MAKAKASSTDQNLKQIEAIGIVYNAVKELTPEAANNVLVYVNNMLAPGTDVSAAHLNANNVENLDRSSSMTQKAPDRNEEVSEGSNEHADAVDGITSVAIKWIRRNGLDADGISKIFSLGLDEIDLVAKKVPGSSMQQKMRSVFLLKGVASFLGSGAARFSHDQAKEACEHYNAWDKKNSSTYFKALAPLVGGGVSSGYTLTARGLAEAAELIKEMLQSEKQS